MFVKIFFAVLAKPFPVSVSIVIVSWLFFSCSKDNHDIPAAIKELIAANTSCECDPYIDEYSYKNEIVYLQSCRGPACDCFVVYYNSNGDRISADLTYSPPDFAREGKLVKHIWSCH